MPAPAFVRHRRSRQSPFTRTMIQETTLRCKNFIYPVFVQDEEGTTPIATLPFIHRYGGQALKDHVREAAARGIQAFALFPVVPESLKTFDCGEAFNPDGLMCRTLKTLKTLNPDLGLIADVALDPYNANGQDGFVDSKGYVDNDRTLTALVKQAQVLAEAGADVIAPSDMMDGRVAAIRTMLEETGITQTIILSYAAKYASSLYGPFREAIGSGQVLVGDKKSYQMDPANRREALREIRTDLEEGADWIMVKPAHTYLDIIADCKAAFGVPTFAYHVSGEYAMWAFAAQAGAIDRRRSLQEILLSMRRAGADGILTYAAFEVAEYL